MDETHKAMLDRVLARRALRGATSPAPSLPQQQPQEQPATMIASTKNAPAEHLNTNNNTNTPGGTIVAPGPSNNTVIVQQPQQPENHKQNTTIPRGPVDHAATMEAGDWWYKWSNSRKKSNPRFVWIDSKTQKLFWGRS
eukprot:PhF_6_TR35070/c0_g1_i1/m.51107